MFPSQSKILNKYVAIFEKEKESVELKSFYFLFLLYRFWECNGFPSLKPTS